MRLHVNGNGDPSVLKRLTAEGMPTGCRGAVFLVALDTLQQQGKKAQDLLECSIEARKASYSPYSNFAVGAALLCENDKIYRGCNVENASYGISICAEQTAIVKAVSDGNTNFKAIAISADSSEITTPCGRCRQFIYEFGGEIRVYCAKPDLKEVLVALSSDLLPSGFNAM